MDTFRRSHSKGRAVRLIILLLLILMVPNAAAQKLLDFGSDPSFDAALAQIIEDAGLAGDFDVGEDGIEQVSFAVIDMTEDAPVFGGVNPDNFIYPASVYKIYVAAEVLSQISQNEYDLDTEVVVADHNEVGGSGIPSDPRPPLSAGDTITVGYGIDLMITRSDNTASNVMIDQATRPRIDSMMHRYGWQGSEVTRKFLPRSVEDPGYADIRGTETNARHAAEFLYRAATGTLVNPWVSQQLMTYLGRQLDTRKLRSGLPRNAMHYHKTGWFSFWTNDVGIVDDGEVRYVIALFTPVPEAEVWPAMEQIAREVHALIRKRAGKP